MTRERFVMAIILSFMAAVLCASIYNEIQHSRKIDALMTECMKDKKEYECHALIKAPDEQRKAINNAALAAGIAAGSVAGSARR